MQVLVRSTYKALLTHAHRVDKEPALRAMLCASPIQVYDHASNEWTNFEGAKAWNDSRKTVDATIRKLNGGKEWYHPPMQRDPPDGISSSSRQRKYPPRGEISDFVRSTYRASPFTTQHLNISFSAVKALTHTLEASKSLEPALTECDSVKYNQWSSEDFSVLPFMPEILPEGAKEGATHDSPGSPARLLVAHPLLPGFFRHSVILLLRLDSAGAFGVIINKPLTNDDGLLVPVWSALPDQHKLFSKHLAQNPIMVGGPVSTANSLEQSLILMHTYPQVKGATLLCRQSGLCIGGDMNSLLALFEEGIAKADRCACILGYSGWGKEQLEGEITHGSWFCVEHRDSVASDNSVKRQANAADVGVGVSASLMQRDSLERVDEPLGAWLSVMCCMGPQYSQLGRLRSLSKHRMDDE